MNRDHATYILCALILGVFLVMTHQRNEVWRDPLTLWSNAAGQSPQKVRPLVNLAMEHQKRGETDRAIEYFSRALNADGPDYHQDHARLNLAMLYIENGQFEVAFEIVNEVLQREPSLDAMNVMALLALIGSNPEEALKLTDRILAILPGNVGNLGTDSAAGHRKRLYRACE